MRKRRLLVLGFVLVAVVAAAALLLPGRPQTLLRANYGRVRRGMTVEEVHAIMGEPTSTVGSPGSPSREGYGWGAIDGYDGSGSQLPPEPWESAWFEFTDGRVTRETWDDGRFKSSVLDSLLERFGR